MDELLASIAAKKIRLDAMRPASREALLALQKFYDVELTYTSNAIEGNTLTLRETAEVIEHGITVGGKSLRDHLEAVDHYDAVLWMREVAAHGRPLEESTVRELHRRIVVRSQPGIAGVYGALPRRIHPFTDGNGRTARLLMNLLLLREGYPPVAVRPEDRKEYLDVLQYASLEEDLGPFQIFMHRRLDATLADYLNALQEALPAGA